MAIRFRQDQNVLIHDLEQRGFAVAFVRLYSNGPGRTADICLENGVRVYWDRPTQFIWAEGDTTLVEKIEAFLRRRYDSGSVTKLMAEGYAVSRVGVVSRTGWQFFRRQLRRWRRRIEVRPVVTSSLFAEPEAFRAPHPAMTLAEPPALVSADSVISP